MISGFRVVHEKIETTLTNPMADKAEGKKYYETHFAFKGTLLSKEILESLEIKHLMRVKSIKNKVDYYGFMVDKVINEFCWWDTNIQHDKGWIDKHL